MVDDLSNDYGNQHQPVLFLEHDVWQLRGNRYDRWWDAYDGNPDDVFVPLVMVDSGHWLSFGYEDGGFEAGYRRLVDAALQRPAKADVNAYWQRNGNKVHVIAQVTNWSGTTLNRDNWATINAFVWENYHAVHTNRIVREVISQAIDEDLPHGETATYELDTEDITVVQWRMARVMVLVDYRPDPAERRFDSLQAAEAELGWPPTVTPVPTITPTPTVTPTITPGPSPTPTNTPVVVDQAYIPFCD